MLNYLRYRSEHLVPPVQWHISRTHSSAAYIHKHYSFVLCCSQVFLILAFNGIPLSNSYLCRAVACTAHFFILSSYCWLMNEAFNLYIQITYSTHPAVAGASATLSEAASKYRFLGMGYSEWRRSGEQLSRLRVSCPCSSPVLYRYPAGIDQNENVLSASEAGLMLPRSGRLVPDLLHSHHRDHLRESDAEEELPKDELLFG